MRTLAAILSGAVLFLSLSALATEIPGGPVYGHWYSSGNPYNVNGNINVPVDSTLYIHEGVEVIFQAKYYLEVSGYLEAVGTETDSILFAGITTWMGIIFSNAPDSSHMTYCTITGCWVFYGAAIYCISSNPVITHCTIRNNSGTFYGGIFLENSNSPVSHCTISNNSAYTYGSGITLQNSSAEISYCSITGNGNVNGVGSGIYCLTGCTALISHCNITGNEGIRGGGIFVDAGGNPVISNSTISGNIAYNGGGIHFSDGSSGTITDCIINADSTTNESYAKGGGILISSPGGAITISNSTISNCWSAFGGSAVHIDDAARVLITGSTLDGNICSYDFGLEVGAIYSANCDSLVIDHCDLVKNRSAWFAGGITLSGSTNLTLTNSIFRSQVENDILFESYSSASVSYCDFYGSSDEPFLSPPPGLGELVQVNANGDSCDVYYNIFLDPVFVGLYDHDYNLRWRSPCIDAGDPSSPLDPDNTVCDMGRSYFNQDVMGVVEVYPHEEPIVIPPEGGQLVYDGWVFNFIGYPGRADIWTYAFVPGVGRYGPIDLYRNFRIPPDSIGMNDIRKNVPGLAPAGDYVFAAYVGVYPGTIIDSSYFYFSKSGSAGGGVTSWFDGDVWLKGGDLAESNLPGAYALSQNYPNPFNATTVIEYALPVESHVKLQIYNIRGQKAATLVDSKQQAGYRSVVWDASSVSSGLYFYRLTAGNEVFSERMTLLK